jgi:hypothetical protein
MIVRRLIHASLIQFDAQAKVEHDDTSLRRNEHIARFDIAVELVGRM